MEKDYAYLKQLCNPHGSYTPLEEESASEIDIAQYKRLEEEALGTEF